MRLQPFRARLARLDDQEESWTEGYVVIVRSGHGETAGVQNLTGQVGRQSGQSTNRKTLLVTQGECYCVQWHVNGTGQHTAKDQAVETRGHELPVDGAGSDEENAAGGKATS